VRNKGFVYIMEVVLMSMIILFSLPMILVPIDVDEDWTRVDLRRLGESALGSLEREYGLENVVLREDPTIEDNMSELLHSTGELANIRYGIRMENHYPRSITFGFNCTEGGCVDEDADKERQRLSEVFSEPAAWMNSRYIEFEYERINYENFDEEMGEGGVDVFIIRGEEQYTQARNHQEELIGFLEEGGGLLMFSNNTDSTIFGLGDGPEDGDGSGFKNRENASKPNYEPSKLFYGLGSLVNTGSTEYQLPEPYEGNWTISGEIFTVEIDRDTEKNITVKNSTDHVLCEDCAEGEEFKLYGEKFDGEEVGIRKIIKPDRGIYRRQNIVFFDNPRDFQFDHDTFAKEGSSTEGSMYEVLENGTPYMVVNEPLEGRTVWISETKDGSFGADMPDDVQNLLRAGVLWAAPKNEVLRPVGSPDERTVDIKHMGYKNEEVFEPFKLTLSLWYMN